MKFLKELLFHFLIIGTVMFGGLLKKYDVVVDESLKPLLDPLTLTKRGQ